MEIRLQKEIIENFKGIKSFTLDIGGKNAIVSAQNGTGKTTLYDLFLWVFFGKDSTGAAEFGLRPLDGDNNPIKGLVTVGEITLDIDGKIRVFSRAHHEKLVKKQVRGFTTQYWVDGLAMKKKDYDDRIIDLVATEETFKLLTDLDYFCNEKKFHWENRRGVLLDIAGDIGSPKGFDALLASIGDHELKDYKKILKDRIKRLVKDRDEINPRIDEQQRNLDIWLEKAVDTTEFEKQRHDLKNDLTGLDLKRKEILETQKERQEKIDALNELKNSLADRVRDLKHDTTGIQGLIEEKTKIVAGVADKQMVLSQTEQAIKLQQGVIDGANERLAATLVRLDEARNAYLEAKKTPITPPPVADGLCFNCNQELPDEMKGNIVADRNDIIKEMEDSRKSHLEAFANSARLKNDEYKALADSIIILNGEMDGFKVDLEKAQIEYDESEQYRLQRAPVIDEAIAKNETTPPAKDELCISLNKQIEVAAGEVGEPTVDQLTEIEAEHTLTREKLETVAENLLQADTAKQIQPRIDELNAKENDLAQKIAYDEKELEDIKNYFKAECELIESAVNGKFEHITFRLFKELLKTDSEGNADTVPCCDALLDGVTYDDMSDGEKIFCSIDIINTLSEHFEITVPLFIDRAETFTKDCHAHGQVIEFHAVKGVTALEVKTI